MTDQERQRARKTAKAQTPSLYRTVLGIAVAALVAAWLPFSILYVNAVTKHAIAAAKLSAAPKTSAARRPAQALTPVTTRVS